MHVVLLLLTYRPFHDTRLLSRHRWLRQTVGMTDDTSLNESPSCGVCNIQPITTHQSTSDLSGAIRTLLTQILLWMSCHTKKCKLAHYVCINIKCQYLGTQWADFDDLTIKTTREIFGNILGHLQRCTSINKKVDFLMICIIMQIRSHDLQILFFQTTVNHEKGFIGDCQNENGKKALPRLQSPQMKNC